MSKLRWLKYSRFCIALFCSTAITVYAVLGEGSLLWTAVWYSFIWICWYLQERWLRRLQLEIWEQQLAGKGLPLDWPPDVGIYERTLRELRRAQPPHK